MQPLSDISTTLFLALAARYVGSEPMLADAAALCAGRTRGWSTWCALQDADQLLIAESLRLRPSLVAQPKRFLMSAEAIIKGERSPFELIDASKLSDELHEQDCYRISPHLNADQLIREYFEALKYGRATPVYAQLPESGDVVLKHIAGDQVRVFVVPESERSVLEVADCHIHIPSSPAVQEIKWELGSLRELAQQLDATPNLHSQHEASLTNIWGSEPRRAADSGNFYRVNAPTGTGKSVAMVMMSIDAARRGHRVVIAVPTLVELENTVRILKQSLAVAAADLKVAPLHSATRVYERAQIQFAQSNTASAYDYACLLDARSAFTVSISPLA